MWILVVEDDESMGETLREGLQENGHSITLVQDGEQGWEAARMHDFDAVLLDIMLPGLNGFDLIRRMRQVKSATPILVLTARDAVEDIVNGLDLGANDYLTKPFSFQELLARLRNVARVQAPPPGTRLEVGDLVLDSATLSAARGSRRITLSLTEFRLLECLMRRAGRVVSRRLIFDAVWGIDWHVASNTLEVFVKSLRRKIDADDAPPLIHTVRGVGYRLQAPGMPEE